LDQWSQSNSDQNNKAVSGGKERMNRYAILTCEFPFQATHHLPGYCDPYDRPHSHSYRLQISLRGPVQEDPRRSDDGMVIAFEDLQRSIESMILQGIYLDVPCRDATHGGLDQNDLNRLTGIRTTAEKETPARELPTSDYSGFN